MKPEIEAFDPGMIANAAYYLKKGVLKAPLHFQFCMGCANGIPGSPEEPDLYEGNHGVPVPRLHLELLWWATARWRCCTALWRWAATSAWAWRTT